MHLERVAYLAHGRDPVPLQKQGPHNDIYLPFMAIDPPFVGEMVIVTEAVKFRWMISIRGVLVPRLSGEKDWVYGGVSG